MYPFFQCGAANAELCPFYLHRIDAWYRPKPRVRTFLLNRRRGDHAGHRRAARRLKPVERATFGQLTVYVYSYDIASRLAPAR